MIWKKIFQKIFLCGHGTAPILRGLWEFFKNPKLFFNLFFTFSFITCLFDFKYQCSLPRGTFWWVKHQNPSSNKDFREKFQFWPSRSRALTTESLDSHSQPNDNFFEQFKSLWLCILVVLHVMQLYITLLGVFKNPDQKNEGVVDSTPGNKWPKIPRY